MKTKIKKIKTVRKSKNNIKKKKNKKTIDQNNYYQDIFLNGFKKNKINVMLKLQVKFGLIVPSTYGHDKELPMIDYKKRIIYTQENLGKMFGGFSTFDSDGGYYHSGKNKIIKEKTTIVISYINNDIFENESKMKILFLFIEKIMDKWEQDAIGIIIEDNMFYLSK